MPRSTSCCIAFLSAAGVAVLGTTAASAQPTVAFEDAGNSTPGVYTAGDTFDLNLLFTFDDGDLEGRTGLRSGGITFDLIFANADGTQASAPLTLSGRSSAPGGPFETFTNGTEFSVNDEPADPGRDLGAFTFSFASDAGAAPGTSNIGVYSFATASSLASGSYILDFGGELVTTDTSLDPLPTALTGTSFAFEVIAVPEPASLALLLPATALALGRRRR